MNEASGWVPSNGDFSLPSDEVHVWRVPANLSASTLLRFQCILSADELERAQRFHFAADFRRGVVGRGCLRLLLGQILNLPAKSLRFERSVRGKPRLTATQEQHLQFNVSHSGRWILIAVTRGRAVGVDVEKKRGDLDMDEVAARFFSIVENGRLASLVGAEKCDAFFTCWTRKEAYLKARDISLSTVLDQADVSFFPEEARLLEMQHDASEADRWKLLPLSMPAGYVASLAAKGTDWSLKCWDWGSESLASTFFISH